MKKSYFILIFMLLCLAGNAQWEMSTGLDGGELSSMISFDSILVAVSEGKGVFIKHDTSIWSYNYSYENSLYNMIRKAGNCAFLCKDGAWSWYPARRSFDLGATWELNSNLNNVSQLQTLDSVIFFFSSSGLNRSYDFGTSLEMLQIPEENMWRTVLCDDSLLYLHFWDGDTVHKLYSSNDHGNTWDSMCTNGLFPFPYMDIMQLKTLNGTWWIQARSESAPLSSRMIFIYNGDKNEWIDVTNNLPLFVSHNDLFEYQGYIFCSIDDYPVFRFNYSDSSWVEFTNASKNVNQFLLHNSDLLCATDQGACSLDTAGNWTTYYEGLLHRNISSIAELNGVIYVTANNEVFYSADGGNTFVQNIDAYGFQLIATDSVFYIISKHKFKMSLDQGETWHSYSDSLDDIYCRRINHLSITPGSYYLGTSRGIFRSDPDSISWTQITNGPFSPDFYVQNIEAIDYTVLAGEWVYAQDLYLSSDNGVSFLYYDDFCIFRKLNECYYLLKDSIHISCDLTQSWTIIPFVNNTYPNCIETKGDTVFVGGSDYYGHRLLVMTTNFGGYWQDIISGLPIGISSEPIIRISEVKAIENRLFVGNPESGLWYRDDILVGTSELSRCENYSVLITRAIPNPFNTATTIEYTLEKPENVQITFYNLQGQIVERFEMEQPNGPQQIQWNAEGLPAGLYIIRLQAGNNIAFSKLLLAR